MEIEAITDFNEACNEVHLLIDYSRRNSENLMKYATFNKAAVVLLCSKFEAFFESFLEEYAYHHLNLSSNHSLDRSIYQHIIDCLVTDLETFKGKPDKRREIVEKFEALCGANVIMPINNYEIKAKFKYGKHGEREVERLLRTFGFENYATEDSVKAFFIKFNSLVNIRNNIIHQDATPSLTHQAVSSHLDEIIGFIAGLKVIAISKMSSLTVTVNTIADS